MAFGGSRVLYSSIFPQATSTANAGPDNSLSSSNRPRHHCPRREQHQLDPWLLLSRPDESNSVQVAPFFIRISLVRIIEDCTLQLDLEISRELVPGTERSATLLFSLNCPIRSLAIARDL